MSIEEIGVICTICLASVGAGALLHILIQKIRSTTFKQLADEMIRNAEQEIQKRHQVSDLSCQQKEFEMQREFEKRASQEKKSLALEEQRLKQKEEKIDQRVEALEKRLSELERKENALLQQKLKTDAQAKENGNQAQALLAKLEALSHVSSAEAKELLLKQLSEELQHERAQMVRKSLHEAEENGEREASRIMATAIQRLAVSCVNETTVNTVALPSEDLKGRIIGREGRNIRALEHATGVTLLIDDTPGAIVLSCYNPIRLHIAKMALEDLLQDGRIHPTRIEEAVHKAESQIQRLIKKHGEDAAIKAGIVSLHPDLIELLGKLKFQYSFGQNILDHSLEVSFLMGMMAAELGLDPQLAKRIGLLHDIGKAVSHEMEGTHALIGQEIALRCKERPEVANGIGCHHGEIVPTTVEASLCSAADAISASRQGARSESLDQYVRRLKKLEEIAYSIAGVEKAYAMQAGREMRVIVSPSAFDDDGVILLARDLTKRIENELSFPGKIKVTVIREKKAVEYAI